MKILIAKDILDNKQFLDKFRDKVEERLAKDRTVTQFLEKVVTIEDLVNILIKIAGYMVIYEGPVFDIGISERQAINNIQPYIMWLISRYANESIRSAEDIRQNVEDLLLFDYYKKKGFIKGADKDIGRYKRPSDLSDKVGKINKSLEKSENEKIHETLKGRDVTIHYQDSFHIVVTPRTFETSKLLGSRDWCTARGKNIYNEHVEHGPLYILLLKEGDEFVEEKYQLHFASQQFMDRKDDPDLDRIKQFSFLYRLFSNQPEFNDNLSKKDQIAAFMATFLYQLDDEGDSIFAANDAYDRLKRGKGFDIVSAFEAANKQSDLFNQIVHSKGLKRRFNSLSISKKYRADLLIHFIESRDLPPLSALSLISTTGLSDAWVTNFVKSFVPLFELVEENIPNPRVNVDQYIENAMERYFSDQIIPDKDDFKKKLGAEFIDFWNPEYFKEDNRIMRHFLEEYLNRNISYKIAIMVAGYDKKSFNKGGVHPGLDYIADSISMYITKDKYLFLYSIILQEYDESFSY